MLQWFQALMPKEDRFFGLFSAHSRIILAGATDLRALLDGGDEVPKHCAAILEHEPDWSALPAPTPPSVRRLLQRCLEKDAKRRLRDIGDARLEIEEALHPTSEHQKVTVRPLRVGGWAAAGVGVLAIAIGAAVTWEVRRSGSPGSRSRVRP